MGFADQLEKFKSNTVTKLDRAYEGVVDETFTSIVEGSVLTGAPGQPIRSGKLRNSWQKSETAPHEALIASDDPAARPVEENWSSVVFQNHGPHSVALTVAGFPQIVGAVAQRVK